MNTLIATFNIDTQVWDISAPDIGPWHTDFKINVIGRDYPVFFGDLHFGVEVFNDSQIVQSLSWPPVGLKYISNDQDFIVAHRLFLDPGTAYDLRIWLAHDDISTDTFLSLVTPLPPSPYTSWVWDGNRWVPPIPYPDDGIYGWDESTVSWVPVDTTEPSDY